MRQDERVPFVEALERARQSAYAPGEYAEQESFMRAGEIRTLAARAGIAGGVSVLDLCCGVAGAGRLITRELGCRYLGVDYSASAIDIARARARGLPCRFEVARVPPLPRGTFEVVLLLETMLAFADKRALLDGISGALAAGGRFAFTLEEGRPLTGPERARMPDADTVWLTPLEEMGALLEGAGMVVRWQSDCSRSHHATAVSLVDAFTADAAAIAAQIGRPALDDLIAAHRLWGEWLETGRVRKFAIVAVKITDRALGRRIHPPAHRSHHESHQAIHKQRKADPRREPHAQPHLVPGQPGVAAGERRCGAGEPAVMARPCRAGEPP